MEEQRRTLPYAIALDTAEEIIARLDRAAREFQVADLEHPCDGAALTRWSVSATRTSL